MSALTGRVSDFDQFLGEPISDNAIIRDRTTLQLDEASEFPDEAISALDNRGLQRLYVPHQYGGDLGDFLEPMLAIRHVARRDLTVAVAHGKTFLGAISSWIVGGDLAHHLAPIVLSGSPVSWGLTERGRGSDLVRTETRFDIRTGRLNGGKWPINNATRGRVMSVLARTSDTRDPRSLSLVLVDKSEIARDAFQQESKIATHGVRGADISGIAWSDACLPSGRVLGEPGRGLDIVLRALQITRVTCTALSLGAADRALYQVIEFLSERELYGTRLRRMRVAMADAGAICADFLLAEATSLVGVRHIGVLTNELSLVSSLVKYVVPATVDDIFRNATQFLGARSQLVGTAGAGIFEKYARDNRVVGIFDGNSVVNLHAIINQFPGMSRLTSGVDAQKLPMMLHPERSPAWPELADLRLVSRTGSTLLDRADVLAAQAAKHANARLRLAAEMYARATARVRDEIAGTPRTSAPAFAHFDLAHRLAYVFAGACSLVLSMTGSVPACVGEKDLWLTAVLHRVCARLGYDLDGSHALYAEFAELICERNDVGTTVSFVPGWTHG